jgi:hypothetical protein
VLKSLRKPKEKQTKNKTSTRKLKSISIMEIHDYNIGGSSRIDAFLCVYLAMEQVIKLTCTLI